MYGPYYYDAATTGPSGSYVGGGTALDTIAILDAAAAVANYTGSYAVSAGTNRCLIIAVEYEGTPAALSVTWGGQTLTEIDSTYAFSGGDGGSSMNVYLFRLMESGIAAASGTTFVATGNAVNTATTVHCASYENVDQTSPVSMTDKAEATSSTPNPIVDCDIVVPTNGVGFAVSGSGSGGSPATWANLTKRTDLNTTNSSAAGSFADVSGAGTYSADCTWFLATRAAVVGASLSPSSSGSPEPPPTGTDFDIDAITTVTPNDTNASYSWTHTPTGTPDYAVVAIAQNENSSDSISGVTYGGVAMTRVPTHGFANDTLEEIGAVYLYTLASPPTGAQSVVATKTSASIWIQGISWTTSGASGTPTISSSDSKNESGNEPFTVFNPNGDTGIAFAVMFSGHGSLESVTLIGESIEDQATIDGSQTVFFAHTPADVDTVTIGWTQPWNDLAYSAVLITDPGA